MKFWTAHVHPTRAPILIPERFAWGALFFGPLWLAFHRAWVPAALSLAAFVVIVVFAPDSIAGDLVLGMAILLGLSGQDLRRWSVEHRGYRLSHVVPAHDETGALERLLGRHPDLARAFFPAGAPR